MPSARSAMTGKSAPEAMSRLTTGRSSLRGLQVPKPSAYAASDATTQELRKAALKARTSKLPAHAAIGLTFLRAVLDACADMEVSWGVSRPGEEKRHQDRLAAVLKQIAKKAAKKECGQGTIAIQGEQAGHYD